MRRISLLALSLAVSLTGAPSLSAQRVAAKPDSAARRAAAELLRTMRVEETMRASVEASLDAQVSGNPMLAPFRSVMTEWANKYLSYAEMADAVIEIYATEFTPAELADLLAFYRTPTGAKLLTKTPLLTRRGMEVGMKAAQAHTAELQEMIAKRAAELQKPPQ